MSRSFGVKILLPMDKYNSGEVFATDERLQGSMIRLSCFLLCQLGKIRRAG